VPGQSGLDWLAEVDLMTLLNFLQDYKMQKLVVKPSVVVVQPTGDINASNANALQQQLEEAVNSQPNSFVLVDMSHIASLDSAGLMALVAAMNLAQEKDLGFGLCSLPPSLCIVLEVTQLDQVFQIFADRAACEATLS
jgi:anti-anti-sigma factor